jgi:hypothetical protein
MTIEEFIAKYKGKKVDWDGYYGGQCVDLYRQYIDDVLEFPQPRGVAGAKDFWTNYESDNALKDYYVKVENTPLGVPKRGDVVLWNSGEYGHVAIFVSGDINSFISFDQNWPTLNECTLTEHNYNEVVGWLEPRKFNLPLKQTEIDFDDFEGNRHNVGWYVYEWELEKKKAESVEDAFNDYKLKNDDVIKEKNRTIENLQEQASQNSLDLISARELIKDTTEELKALRIEYSVLEGKLSDSELKYSTDMEIYSKKIQELEDEIEVLKNKVKKNLYNFSWGERFISLFRKG